MPKRRRRGIVVERHPQKDEAKRMETGTAMQPRLGLMIFWTMTQGSRSAPTLG